MAFDSLYCGKWKNRKYKYYFNKIVPNIFTLKKDKKDIFFRACTGNNRCSKDQKLDDKQIKVTKNSKNSYFFLFLLFLVCKMSSSIRKQTL